ncbi:MAG: toll/interleukin-1 receptor domain-containing protein [Pseudomonadota bacterium]
MSEYFRFAAFISYSSKDRSFAEKLMKRLEGYAIPKRLGEFDITGAGKKNRVYPIFKDREELSAGDLDDQLKAALRASANLIVISSENATQSDWVNQEIEYFASLGKKDNIFTIITPDSGKDKNANAELFPEKLRELFGTPLAADARSKGDGFRNALLKIVAGTVGINAGELQDRDRKRRRGRVAAWLCACLGLTSVAALSAWAFALPTYTYAKDYVRVFGKLTPVDIVSLDQFSKRQKTYRFKKYGYFGSVSMMELVNSAGNCPDPGLNPVSLTGDVFEFECSVSRACAIKQLYEEGQLSGEEVLDQAGNVLERISYRPGSNQAIREEAVVGCSRLDNGIKFIEIDRSEQEDTLGYDKALRFFAAPGVPRANSEFSYGYLIERDKDGRLLRRTATDKDGNPTLNKKGYSILANTYNANGDKIERKYLDEVGQLTDISKFPAKFVSEYDSFGNEIIEFKFTSNGSANTDSGFHARRITYDEGGYLSALEYLNPSLARTSTENGIARKAFKYNENGHIVEEIRWATDPGDSVSSCAHEKYELTKFGSRVGGACFDHTGEAVIYKGGHHRWRAEIDDALNAAATEFYSVDGTPTAASGGHFRRENTWNELGQKVAVAHFGPAGEPAINGEGIHKWVDEFDVNGYRVRSFTFDAEDNPVYDKYSIYHYEWERDEYGQLVKSTPYDINGNIIESSSHHYSAEHDEFGNITAYTYLDKSGKAANLKAGYAIQKRQYDPQGRLSEVRFFDENSAPAQGWSGAFIVRYRYNSLGKMLEETFLDKDENPMLNERGAAYIRYTYNSLGHGLERQFFGVDNQPIKSTYGAHRIVWEKDVFDQILSGRYFDTMGDPALNAQAGYHGWSNVWDARGNLIEQTTHGLNWGIAPPTDDRKYAILKRNFDTLNRLIETRYFDASGSATKNQRGVYGELNEYDNNNRVIKKTYLGADGGPKAATDSQTAFETKKYDVLGNVVEVAYFREDGSPVTEFAAIEKSTRDRFGNLLVSEGFGPDGERQALRSTGRAISKYTYDHLGNILTEESFDTDGRPFNRLDTMWFKKIYDRSSSGALLSETCYTTDREDVPCDL